MTNKEMTPNRYLHLFRARRCFNDIMQALEMGQSVRIANYLYCTEYKRKHAKMFRLNWHHVQVQSGKHWNTIFQSGMPVVSIQFHA